MLSTIFSTVSPSDPASIVRCVYEQFDLGNTDALLALCHHDIIWTAHGLPEQEQAWIYKGRSGVAQFFTDMAQLYHPLEFEPHSFTSCGATVYVEGSERFVWGVADRKYQASWMHVFTVRDRLLTSFTEYFCPYQLSMM